MKDDINSILDSMFSGGKLHFGKSNSGTEKSTNPSELNKIEKRDFEAPIEINSTDNETAERLLAQRQAQNRERNNLTKKDTTLTEQFQKAKKENELANLAAEEYSDSLQKSLEQLTKDVHKDMKQIHAQMDKDQLNPGQFPGAKGSKHMSAQPEEPTLTKQNESLDIRSMSDKIEAGFETAEKRVNDKVLGQSEFVSLLAIAFKRPFVTGLKHGMPSSRTLLLGKNGSGKHSALENFTIELQKQGVLKSGKVAYIDMSKYRDTSSEKVFVQDLYSILKSESEVLAFENCDQAHSTVIQMVSMIFTNGEVKLSGRYARQKGMLVDIGTALVPNTVSSISAEGKYIFLLTDKDERRLGDVFGMPFLRSIDSICKTKDLEEEMLQKIAIHELERLCKDAKKRLSLILEFTETEVRCLVRKYSSQIGVSGVVQYADKLFKALGEYKLKGANPENKSGQIKAKSEELVIEFSGGVVELDASATLSDAAILEVKAELDQIVGLKDIKNYVLSLEDHFKIQMLRKSRGLKSDAVSMHMIFTGNPGTGKTTIARIVARYLKAIGILTGGQLVEVTRADLVGKYVGHTAPLTQKAIDAAMGGVLFIDEAYALYRSADDSFGLEAIDTLVKGMEDNRERLVVILAGYSKEMKSFLDSNSGLKSRFPNIIEFPDYSANELMEITKSIINGKGYVMDESVMGPLLKFYEDKAKQPEFKVSGNGRLARNKVEGAIISASSRNVLEENPDLELLLPADFGLGDSN